MKKTTFIPDGHFYKGNIHTHTTRSDGQLPPEVVISEYRKRGYNFLILTEHNRYTDLRGYDSENFILLPGMEINPPPDIHAIRDYHFLCLPGTKEMREKAVLPPYPHDHVLDLKTFHTYEDLQEMIDDAYNRGNMITINHPFWSKVEYDEILPLKHLFAMEVFNYCSYVLENVGTAFSHWDAVLRNGMRLWGTAVDDGHNFYPFESGGNDSFGGWITVKAKSLTQDDLMEAIAAGSFYGSAGPEIHDFYVEDGIIHFSCSPVSRIFVNGQQREIRVKWHEPGDPPLTELTCPLWGDCRWCEAEKYVRVECIDEFGRKAFTNPIWLDD